MMVCKKHMEGGCICHPSTLEKYIDPDTAHGQRRFEQNEQSITTQNNIDMWTGKQGSVRQEV